MLLSNVLKNLKEKKVLNLKKFNPDIKGIGCNSKKILKNFIFVAIKGQKDDGHKFISEAIEKGANLIVFEKKELKKKFQKKTNFIYTKNSKLFLSKIAANFYLNQPNYISAVTGTNGKTSVVYIANEIWKNCKIKSACLGTLGLIKNKEKIVSGLTTENSIEIHKTLSLLSKQKINKVSLEASSHGLHQHRLDSLKLGVAAFTNISQDHFDYHKNFKNYFKAKMRIFSEILKKNGIAIINSDLPESKKIINLCKKKKKKIFTYGYNSSDLKLITYYKKNNNQKIIIKYKNKILNYEIPLLGDFQVYNSLCAISLVIFSGVPIIKLLKVMKKIKSIPGRLEKIKISHKIKKNISVFVDYAHTPNALKESLKILKKDSNLLSVVFGCGGDRDKKKRALMGKIASAFADKIYITDDNPRFESPKKIRKEIISGCPSGIEIKNRYLAIKKAIKNSKEGEYILIAGKGHENYQIIGKKIYKYSDKGSVLEILKKI